MDVTPLVPQGQQIIQSYSNGGFRVSGTVFKSPVIVALETTVPWDVSEKFEDLTMESFAPLLAQARDIDVVLLGCGKDMAFLPLAIRQELKARGLPVESMDTGAACRTFNVLMTEGRRVVAALLPV